MPWSAYLLIAGLSLSAGLNWYGAWAQKLRLYYATKPIVLLLLIALFILWGGTLPSALPFLLGLGFSLLGDICLIPRSQTWFLAGLVAFLRRTFFISTLSMSSRRRRCPPPWLARLPACCCSR